ncbi:sulfur carrier protein ThiS [Clostridium niameyense]|uniref:Sulfur carrier protein ThiS n=1 Tax=Clostridium niameyense TaxID=1622073 RepID=A0A6M0R9A9_9CLOT|nr:sulfur carrier protein ThiS [Clostridium niameyense]NEZ46841.1 sulfur carrier protein ThiS [Clostridium niameyense]
MIVNGKENNLYEGITVLDMLNKMNLDASTVVIELNFNILEKEKYKSTFLNSDSKVEVIRFVGGG